jgi:hypothetical protein
MNHSDSSLASGLSDIPGALHIDRTLEGQTRPTHLYDCRRVNHPINALEGFGNSSAVTHISQYPLYLEAGEGTRIACVSNQHSNRVATVQQQANHIVANQTSGSGNEKMHGVQVRRLGLRIGVMPYRSDKRLNANSSAPRET